MAAIKCIICGVRNGMTKAQRDALGVGQDFSDQCRPCHQEAGWENTHSDYGHDVNGPEIDPTGAGEEGKRVRDCWICFPELNEAKKLAKAIGAKKEQGFRRPQLNHKGHAHPQTPKARRECKAAFWAQTTMNSYSTDQLVQAMVAWDAKQAPQTEAKPTKAPGYTLVSTGPKHGVVAQLKATKPKKNS